MSMCNRHMVEMTDLMKTFLFNALQFEGKKWHFLLFCFFLNMCVNNAWLIAPADDCTDNMLAISHSIEQCRLTYMEYGISANNPSEQRLSATFLSRAAQFDQTGHYIIKSDPQIRKRCKHCCNQTIFICKKCYLALHLKCSLKYHTVQ